MSLLPKNNLEIVDPFGEIINFTDTTGGYATNNTDGYGTPNLTYAQVGGVNLLIGNYVNIVPSALGVGAALVPYTQYIKTSGTAKTYDGKSIAVGNYIVPHTTGLVVAAGDTFETTGYYNPLITPSRWKPTAAGTPLYLNTQELGYTTLGVIPDSILTLQYEVYGIVNTSSGFTAAIGTKYLVTGTGNVTYSGSTYRQGEIFTASAATAVALVAGTGTFGVAPYNSGAVSNFQTIYNLETSLVELQTSNILSPKTQSREYNYQVATIFTNIYTMQNAANIGLVSLGQAYNNIVSLQQEVDNLTNNIY
jgi:hypothetical protein